MKKFIKILSIVITLSLIISSISVLSLINASAEQITVANVFGTNVRVRSSKSTADLSNFIEYISKIEARVLQIEGDWLYISYNKDNTEKQGYIFNSPEWVYLYTYDPDATNPTFEQQLAAFPESYHASLRALHNAYPNWTFVADPVAISFDYAVYLETINMRKQVGSTLNFVSWRSMGETYYNWTTGAYSTTNEGWMAASRETIAYYMDPRNFLNANDIYQFLQQGYRPSTQTEEGLKKIIAGTFLEQGYSDPENVDGYNGSYVAIIMDAAAQAGVSPYILASKIKQEIGSQVSNMVSGTYPGYENLYNFFNIGASGNDGTVLINGLEYARSQGWTSRPAAIIGGAKFLGNNYISGGQSTYYYQDFNVHDPNNMWHQYAQAVFDAYTKGRNLTSTYSSESNLVLEFYIPVYSKMPDSPCVMPPKSNELANNYYFSELSVQGLAPSFYMYTYEYSLEVSGDTAIKFAVPIGATYLGQSSYSLNTGVNEIVLTVKSETGFTNDYRISVLANKNCTLHVNTTGTVPVDPSVPPTQPTVTFGDPNDDGVIDIVDLAIVQMQILGLTELTDDALIAADPNKDGVVDIIDLAIVQMHILEIKFIEQ